MVYSESYSEHLSIFPWILTKNYRCNFLKISIKLGCYNFQRMHRVLSWDPWSGWVVSFVEIVTINWWECATRRNFMASVAQTPDTALPIQMLVQIPQEDLIVTYRWITCRTQLYWWRVWSTHRSVPDYLVDKIKVYNYCTSYFLYIT